MLMNNIDNKYTCKKLTKFKSYSGSKNDWSNAWHKKILKDEKDYAAKKILFFFKHKDIRMSSAIHITFRGHFLAL